GRGSVIETEASDERAVEPPRVQAGNGSEDRDHGADRLPDSGSMGGRLAEAGEEARSGEPADPGVEGPSGAGGGGDLADAKHEPLGAARDHANVRDRPRTARVGVHLSPKVAGTSNRHRPNNFRAFLSDGHFPLVGVPR